MKTPTHLDFTASAAVPLRYFIPFIDVHLRSGEQVSRTVVLSDPALGEGE
jgi:hypothetical protein